jgi:hypothetical protein
MRELESAALNLAIALSEFGKALDTAYRLRQVEQAQFPNRQAQILLQQEVKAIANRGLSPIQSAGLLGAWAAWRPQQAINSLAMLGDHGRAILKANPQTLAMPQNKQGTDLKTCPHCDATLYMDEEGWFCRYCYHCHSSV